MQAPVGMDFVLVLVLQLAMLMPKTPARLHQTLALVRLMVIILIPTTRVVVACVHIEEVRLDTFPQRASSRDWGERRGCWPSVVAQIKFHANTAAVR